MDKLMNAFATMTDEQLESIVDQKGRVQEAIPVVELALKGIAACKKTLLFPMGTEKIQAYKWEDGLWGTVTRDGILTCWISGEQGSHMVGQVNLLRSKEVILALNYEDLSEDLERFLREQIEKAEKMEKT